MALGQTVTIVVKLPLFPKITKGKAFQADFVSKLTWTENWSNWRHFWFYVKLKHVNFASFPKVTRTEAHQVEVISEII